MRRLLLPEMLIAYAEQLGRARTTPEVRAALVDHAPRVVGGYSALLFSATPPEDDAPAAPAAHDRTLYAHLALAIAPRLERPCLVTAGDALSGTGGPFSHLSPLFDELGARTVAAMPTAGGDVLVVVERRADRLFEAEDWDLLRTLTVQADAALERVRLFEEVRELALTDALTGLANRRQLMMVLERGTASARRGESLAVAMIDVDGFREINEARGHPGGDRALCAVAAALRAEARGSDLVARFGGDEFCLVLPGGTRPSALAFLRRVGARLAGVVSVSAGITEYDASAGTPEELIAAADRDLYRAKAAIRARRAPH